MMGVRRWWFLRCFEDGFEIDGRRSHVTLSFGLHI